VLPMLITQSEALNSLSDVKRFSMLCRGVN
jgi:hypothetical protein